MANPIGISWGATPGILGDAGGVVTWSLGPAGSNIGVFSGNTGFSVSGVSFLNFDFTAVIRAAFADWSRYGNIEFLQVEDGGGAAGSGFFADIRIFFGDIPGSTIGWAFYPTRSPSAVAGDILLDAQSSFNDQQGVFRGLVLHEIGHALGLGHVNFQSVMTPSIQFTSLQQDDINGIRAVYGPQDNQRPIYTIPDGRNDVNILDAPARIIVNGNGLDNRIDGTWRAEKFVGKGGNDELIGQRGIDDLFGNDGEDSLFGNRGNDNLFGGADNDFADGGGGRDSISGGPGNDVLLGGANNDTVMGASGHDTVKGQDGNDQLLGQAGNDSVLGGNGNDIANGGGGVDIIRGQAGNDTLIGGAGNDQLFGDSGNDRLVGGPGNDTVNGGGGNDVFVFADFHGNDVVNGFNALNNKEKLDFRGVSNLSNIDDISAPGGAAQQQGADVLIDTGDGNSVLLRNVQLDDLDDSDFIF